MSDIKLQPVAGDGSEADFADLVACHLAGELTNAQRNQLSAELTALPERRTEFVAMCIQAQLVAACVGLEFAAEEGLVDSSDDEDSPPGLMKADSSSPIAVPFLATTVRGTVGYFSEGMPLAYLLATVIFGVGLLIGSRIYVSGPERVAQQSVPLPTIHYPLPTTHSTVGRITGMVDCRWSDPATEAFSGAYVPLGRKYSLASGLMEITYDTGAKVILQGPVTYEVESKDGGYLSVGKLTARVEKKQDLPSPFGREAGVEGGEKNGNRSESQRALTLALSQRERGPDSFSALHPPPSALFAVRTPTATVTDLGTEFGVEVAESGATSTHVFRGVVELQPAVVDGKQGGQAVRLIENESAKVEKQSGGEGLTVHRGAANAAAFVRSKQLVKAAQETREKQELKPFERWWAYSEQLRRDPSLLAYYDFQQKPGAPTVLPNVAANGDESLDGVVENATWTTGRMPGKHALQFNGPADYVQINLPRTVDDLTIAAWINVQSLDNSLNGLLMSDNWGQDGQVHWQLLRDGRISFVVGGQKTPYVSASVLGLMRPSRWVHLAVVYDHAAACAKFYLDGQTIVEEKLQEHIPICIGPARIGQWNINWPANDTGRNFHGRIDEFAIFGRPLKWDEIRRMFEEGRPSGVQIILKANRVGTRQNTTGVNETKQQPLRDD